MLRSIALHRAIFAAFDAVRGAMLRQSPRWVAVLLTLVIAFGAATMVFVMEAASEAETTPLASFAQSSQRATVPFATNAPGTVARTKWIAAPRACPAKATAPDVDGWWYDCNNPRCAIYKPCPSLADAQLERCGCPHRFGAALTHATDDTLAWALPLAGHYVRASTAPKCSVPRPVYQAEFLCAMGYSWNFGVSLEALWSLLGADPLHGGCTVHNTLIVDMSPEVHMKRFLIDGERDMKTLDPPHPFPKQGLHFLAAFNETTPFDCINVYVPPTGVPLPFTMFQNIISNFAVRGGYRWHFWQHMDAVVVPPTAADAEDDTSPLDVFEYLGTYVSRFLDWHPHTGIIYTHYDHVASYTAELSSTVHWDPSAPQYGSDCDFYATAEKKTWVGPTSPGAFGRVFHGDAVQYHDDPHKMYELLVAEHGSAKEWVASRQRQQLKNSFKGEVVRAIRKGNHFHKAGRKFLASKWGAYKSPCGEFFDWIQKPGFMNGAPSALSYSLSGIYINSYAPLSSGAPNARCPAGSRHPNTLQAVATALRKSQTRWPRYSHRNYFSGDITGKQYSDRALNVTRKFVCLDYGLIADAQTIIGIALGDATTNICPPCFQETERVVQTRSTLDHSTRNHRAVCVARRSSRCTDDHLNSATTMRNAIVSEDGFIDVVLKAEDVEMRTKERSDSTSNAIALGDFECPHQSIPVRLAIHSHARDLASLTPGANPPSPRTAQFVDVGEIRGKVTCSANSIAANVCDGNIWHKPTSHVIHLCVAPRTPVLED